MGKRAALLSAIVALAITSQARAMSYGVVAIEDGSCANRCPLAIVAAGKIESDESVRFLEVLDSVRMGGGVPRYYVVSSPGGDLIGALALGLNLRRLGIRTVVGSIAASPQGIGALGPGMCGSACVFVLMAGVSRTVVPGSRVAVHAPQVVLVGHGQQIRLSGALSQLAVRGVEPVLQAYARRMGVAESLISVSNSVPNETSMALTSAELARYRLVTGGAAREHSRATREASKDLGRAGRSMPRGSRVGARPPSPGPELRRARVVRAASQS